MFGFSGEHLLVLLVILVIFGPKRLPDLGHSIGRSLKNFKDAMAGTPGHVETQAIPPASQIASAPNVTEAREAMAVHAEKIEPK